MQMRGLDGDKHCRCAPDHFMHWLRAQVQDVMQSQHAAGWHG